MQAGHIDVPFFDHHHIKENDSHIDDSVQSPRSVSGPRNGLYHKVCLMPFSGLFFMLSMLPKLLYVSPKAMSNSPKQCDRLLYIREILELSGDNECFNILFEYQRSNVVGPFP